MRFVDSAYAPTLAQVELAMEEGYEAWGFYLAGPGAMNNWTPAQVAVLRQGGMSQGLPIYVPKLDLTTVPAVDAQIFANAMEAAGVFDVGVLDTEASMRGNPRLQSYVNGFVDELDALGIEPVVYGGANYMPAGSAPWWIKSGTPLAGEAYQHGSGSIGGLTVDFDTAAVGFPFASLVIPDPPPPPSPIQSPRGTDMLYTVTIPTDANGNGYEETTIPWANFMAISIEGSDPAPTADDRYFMGTPHVQDRDGNVLASVTGCPANSPVNVFILATQSGSD